MSSTLPPELLHELQIAGLETRTDAVSRLLYSTDASIYQIEPLGVAFPHHEDELIAAVALAARHGVPILARGAGSSLAGQAIGPALILDCSRYLDRIIALDTEARTATVEPGVILNTLNRAAAQHGLQFGPDPASAERATLGGSIANNASGAHSILYGMCADHLVQAEVVLADGSLATFGEISPHSPPSSTTTTLAERFTAAVLGIRQRYADAIRSGWPRTWRNASGYNLPYLLPWYPSAPPLWQPDFNPSAIYNDRSSDADQPPSINLAALLAGSEGTLAVIRRAVVRLVSKPRHTILGVLAYETIEAACDDVHRLLGFGPAAVELIPHNLIRLARGIPAAAGQLSWLDSLPSQWKGDQEQSALLVIEFCGDDAAPLEAQAQSLGPQVLLAKSAKAQSQVWAVRKLGLGILQSRPGERKPVTFIEDMAVPVERLGEFVREMNRIMAEHGSQGDFYAHASAGCLHMRPILNLKAPTGLKEMRAIGEAAAALVARLGGTMSGEHSDGMARGEWLERIYGPQILAAFRELKAAADPHNLLNPGKIVAPPPFDTNLRPRASAVHLGWQPVMDFTRQGGAPGAAGYVGAIEMCNGAGVCRKLEGTMCPSFQATRDEKYATRGRANLLRAMLTAPLPPSHPHPDGMVEAAFDALNLCLACKGCKAECPSAVDMAKLKYEFLHAYYRNHRRKLRDYLFGYIGVVAPLGAALAPLVNWIMRQPMLRQAMERFFGLSCQRPFPQFVRSANSRPQRALKSPSQPRVLLLPDAFNRYFYPHTEQAALHVLETAGVEVVQLPVLGAGRTLISKGFLTAAKRHAARLVAAIDRLDPQGELPIVGLEPSEIYTLRDEFPDFFPNDPRVAAIAQRAWMIDEYLLRCPTYTPRPSPIANHQPMVLLHGHCYQKAQPPAADGLPVGVAATVKILELAGFSVRLIDDGCCGMAGAFGYEAEHLDLSMKVGELVLFPTVRQANPETIIVTAGVSCHSQIQDGTQRASLHPVMLLSDGALSPRGPSRASSRDRD